MSKKIVIPQQKLENMLYIEHKSISQIAQELGIAKQTVSSNMKDYGLKIRSEYNKENITKDILEQKYVKEQRSIKNLAKELGCGRDWLRTQLVSYGFLKPKQDEREKPELTLEFFQKEYYNENLALNKIAKKYGFHIRTVRNAFRKLGLKTKREIKLGNDTYKYQQNCNYAITNENDFINLVNKGYSVSDLALYYDCSQSTIYSTMKRFGLSFDTFCAITKEQLYDEYIIKQNSFETIAAKYGCSCGTIRNRAIEYEIPIRKSDEINKVNLDEKYVSELLKQHYSYTAIAELVDCSMGTIRNFAINNGYEQEHFSNVSSQEAKIINMLDSDNISIEMHNRKILNGKEIDVLTDNIGIEINPCFTHNSDYNLENRAVKPEDYHYGKWVEAANNNIILLSKFDWVAPERILFYTKLYKNLLPIIPEKEYNISKIGTERAIQFLNQFSDRPRCSIIDEDICIIAEYVDCFNVSHDACLIVVDAESNIKCFDMEHNYNHIKALELCVKYYMQKYEKDLVRIVAKLDLSENVLLSKIGFITTNEIKQDMKFVHIKGKQFYERNEIHKAFPETIEMTEQEIITFMNKQRIYRVFGCGQMLMYYENRISKDF